MPHPVQPTSPDLGEGGSDSGQLTPTGGGGTAASAAAAAAVAAAATAASLADYNQSTSKGHEILSQVRTAVLHWTGMKNLKLIFF